MNYTLTYLDLNLVIYTPQMLELSVIAPPAKVSGVKHVAPIAHHRDESAAHILAERTSRTHPSFVNGSRL